MSPFSEERTSALQELERRLGYHFVNLQLAEQAFTHSSYVHEAGDEKEGKTPVDYEALEFLGDSILGFVISEFLFITYPELSEGDLSKIKSHLVSAKQLHLLSKELDLGRFLNLSRGEEKTGGRRKKAILADLFESLTAAIYLDGGIEPTREFILAQFRPILEEIAKDELNLRDHKSPLQEKLHGMGLPGPQYRVLNEFGPDHNKQFQVSVSSEGQVLGEGSGRSKKEAEQQAARNAIEVIGRDPHPSGERTVDLPTKPTQDRMNSQ